MQLATQARIGSAAAAIAAAPAGPPRLTPVKLDLHCRRVSTCDAVQLRRQSEAGFLCSSPTALRFAIHQPHSTSISSQA